MEFDEPVISSTPYSPPPPAAPSPPNAPDSPLVPFPHIGSLSLMQITEGGRTKVAKEEYSGMTLVFNEMI